MRRLGKFEAALEKGREALRDFRKVGDARGVIMALIGGPYGYATSVSYGPVVTAIAPPTGNACPPDTDTNIAAYTRMEYHQNNPTGPTCSVAGTGCTTIGSTRGEGSAASSRMPAAMPIVRMADAMKATIGTAGGNDRAMRAPSFGHCGGLLMRSR